LHPSDFFEPPLELGFLFKVATVVLLVVAKDFFFWILKTLRAADELEPFKPSESSAEPELLSMLNLAPAGRLSDFEVRSPWS